MQNDTKDIKKSVISISIISTLLAIPIGIFMFIVGVLFCFISVAVGFPVIIIGLIIGIIKMTISAIKGKLPKGYSITVTAGNEKDDK